MSANVQEILELSSELIRLAAVSTGENIAYEQIHASFVRIRTVLEAAGLNVIAFDGDARFPAIYCDAQAPGSAPCADTLLAGHFDVVPPHDELQLEPAVDGDWLRGRGSADMLTVVSTGVSFMCDVARKLNGREAPRFGLLLVGNEECGETEAWGTPHILADLKSRFGYVPRFIIAGERTGEGAVPYGLVEVRNRGIIRVHAEASGAVGHTALVKGKTAFEKIFALERAIREGLGESSDDFWKSSFQVSYVHGGEALNFNISAKRVVAGFEVRPAIASDLERVMGAIERTRDELEIDVQLLNSEPAVASDPDDPMIRSLIETIAEINGVETSAVLGRGKLPGSQARFVPPGCAAIVWGQAGVGPHTSFEAHYIPSIEPFYAVLEKLYGA